jgi:TRAP-type C4-dicarboxylate transport system substrate-binding protein
VKYVTDSPLAYLYGTLMIRRKDFEQLSPADQAIVREVMSSVFNRLNSLSREESENAFNALRAQGIELVSSNQQERERWRNSVDTAMNKLLQNGLFSVEVMRQVEGLLDNYRKADDAR